MDQIKYAIFDTTTEKAITKDGRLLVWSTPSGPNYVYKILNDCFPNRFKIKNVTYNGREGVEAYLKSSKVISTEPLYFIAPRTHEIITCVDTKNSLETNILSVIKYAQTYGSQRKTAENNFICETSYGRSRSSLDIWRHIKAFLPEITIYDVMHSLSIIMKTQPIVCSYCSYVKRRVFHTAYGTRPQIYNGSTQDEYGLYFSEWEKI